MEQKKYQRKTIFIKPTMQFKFIAFIMLAVLFGMALISYEFISLLGDIFAKHPALLEVFYQEGSALFTDFIIKISICFVLLALLAAVISHKIAGPVYRAEVCCRRVAKGDLSVRMYLRDKDAFKNLEKEFNLMMDSLEKKYARTSAPQNKEVLPTGNQNNAEIQEGDK